MIGERQDGVVFEHLLGPAAGLEDPGDVLVGGRKPATLGLQPVMVGYGVALEEVDEVKRRGFLFDEHRAHPRGVVVVDADGAEDAAVRLASAETGVAAVE